MFTAIYTFLSYFEHTSFLYTEPLDVWFHASFFAAVGGALCHMVGGFALFIDEDISKAKVDEPEFLEKKKPKTYQSSSYTSRYTGHRHVPQVSVAIHLAIRATDMYHRLVFLYTLLYQPPTCTTG